MADVNLIEFCSPKLGDFLLDNVLDLSDIGRESLGILPNHYIAAVDDCDEAFLSVGTDTKRYSYGEAEQQENNSFSNSVVFIEARHLASRFADGSIFNQDNDDDILDHTTEPKELHELINDKSDIQSNDEVAVFKAIDRFLPVTAAPSCSHNNHQLSEPKQTTRFCDNNNNTDINIVLNSLSSILSINRPTRQQISLGQQYVAQLSNFLNNKMAMVVPDEFQNIHESSNHYSNGDDMPTNGVQIDYYEVLDLSCKNNPNNSIHKVIVLSPKTRGRCSTTPFNNAANRKPFACAAGALKSAGSFLRKATYNNDRKGPLKAVIPMQNIMGKSEKIFRPSINNNNKISTPTKNNNLMLLPSIIVTPVCDQPKKGSRPVAQSTPDPMVAISKQQQQQRIVRPTLVPPTQKCPDLKINTNKIKRKSDSYLSKRRSASVGDNMKQVKHSGETIRRSLSTGKVNGITSMSKDVDNLKKLKSIDDSNNKRVFTENSRSGSTKLPSTFKNRRTGKENLGY